MNTEHEEIAHQLVETWFDAPDGYRGMALHDEERDSLKRLIVTALINQQERDATVAVKICRDEAAKWSGSPKTRYGSAESFARELLTKLEQLK